MRYELGFEMRMRIMFATLSGFFYALALGGFALGSTGGAIAFGLFASALMWVATNNRWFARADHR